METEDVEIMHLHFLAISFLRTERIFVSLVGQSLGFMVIAVILNELRVSESLKTEELFQKASFYNGLTIISLLSVRRVLSRHSHPNSVCPERQPFI
jgi:hypothetical protein